MKTRDFDYNLPEELIAQVPAARREDARLLVYRRADDSTRHLRVKDLPALVPTGALMVFNDTKVVPARLFGRKPTGGKVELLLLGRIGESPNLYAAIGQSRRPIKTGDAFTFPEGLTAKVRDKDERGVMEIAFHAEDDIAGRLERAGLMPLPPYIARGENPSLEIQQLDRERYQTVYAREPGAVAAPTAGLHFTPEMLRDLDNKGIERVHITLHVGPGTFQPVRAEDIAQHVMHSEDYEITPASAEKITRAKREGRPVLAVGTTSCRALESALASGVVVAQQSATRLFIQPGYQFRVIDVLMTNFHTPRSTLLMLVSAFAGREKILDLYAEAVRQRYRFYSYGDAMLIL